MTYPVGFPVRVLNMSPPAPDAATTDVLSTIAACVARALTGAGLPLAGGGAVSVQVYPPPLTSMTFFDVAGDGTVVPSATRRGDVALESP